MNTVLEIVLAMFYCGLAIFLGKMHTDPITCIYSVHKVYSFKMCSFFILNKKKQFKFLESKLLMAEAFCIVIFFTKEWRFNLT